MVSLQMDCGVLGKQRFPRPTERLPSRHGRVLAAPPVGYGLVQMIFLLVD